MFNPLDYIPKGFWAWVGEKFKLLRGLKQIVVIATGIMLILLILIVVGHILEIAVSIGPTDSQNQWPIPLLWFITAVVFSLILFFISFCFMSKTKPRVTDDTKVAIVIDSEIKPEKKDIADKDIKEQPYPKILTVHVVLPTSEGCGALGDGLLQAAGFLAANDAFKNINIKPYDHENEPIVAQEKLRNILREYRDKEEPICVVYTMSSICEAVEDVLGENEFIKCPDLSERLSIIFTVASAPKTPHDGKNLFQHFVTGKEEAEKIATYCLYDKAREKTKDSTVLLLTMASPYSEQTARDIKKHLDKNFTSEWVSFRSDGKVVEKDKGRIARIIEQAKKGNRHLIAIAVAYDQALYGAIKELCNADYEGLFLATTTLSVKDWQKYLEEKNYLRKFDIGYTTINGFDPEDETTTFAKKLYSWKFPEIISQRNFYHAEASIVRSWFDNWEQDVYKDIDPNYISAFCFDSVRLFSEMQSKKAWCLSELNLPEKGDRYTKRHCPFEANEIFKDKGKTKVSVAMAWIHSRKES